MSASVFDQRILDAAGRPLFVGTPVRRRGERGLLGRCLFVWHMHWFETGYPPEIEVEGEGITTHKPACQTADGHWKFDLLFSPVGVKETAGGC